MAIEEEHAEAEGDAAAGVERIREQVREAVRFFEHGLSGFMQSPAINEAINPSVSYAGAADYVASATNVLRAVRLLQLDSRQL